jgi:hypothetical protein
MRIEIERQTLADTGDVRPPVRANAKRRPVTLERRAAGCLGRFGELGQPRSLETLHLPQDGHLERIGIRIVER